MKFSASHAAFEGFRVTRQHPLAVLIWSLVALASLIVTALTALPILGPVIGELQTLMTHPGTEPSALLAARMSYATMATLPISVVTQAVMLPALYRAMKHEGRDRFGYLRLGREELRVLMVLAVIALISLVLVQAGDLVALLLAASGLGFIGGVVDFVATLASIYISVRLVLAVPATFAQDRVDMRGAWNVTAGLFLPLFGLAILAGVMAAIVILLLVIVALPLSAGMLGAAAASPLGMASAAGVLILMAIGFTLVTTIVSAPFMAVYRELTNS